MTLDEIDQITHRYANAREELHTRVLALTDTIEEAKRRKMPGIKKAVRDASEAMDRLHAALEASPSLFVKPRTVVIAGIRIGFAKGAGKLVIDDPDKVVGLIRKHHPDQADLLIKVSECPIRKALANLSVADLKKLGVTVEDTGDQVVIKPTDSEVDKLVDALLKDHDECSLI